MNLVLCSGSLYAPQGFSGRTITIDISEKVDPDFIGNIFDEKTWSILPYELDNILVENCPLGLQKNIINVLDSIWVHLKLGGNLYITKYLDALFAPIHEYLDDEVSFRFFDKIRQKRKKFFLKKLPDVHESDEVDMKHQLFSITYQSDSETKNYYETRLFDCFMRLYGFESTGITRNKIEKFGRTERINPRFYSVISKTDEFTLAEQLDSPFYNYKKISRSFIHPFVKDKLRYKPGYNTHISGIFSIFQREEIPEELQDKYDLLYGS